MGRRGPAPTPTKVLQMRGTFRPDRHAVTDDAKAPPLTKLPKPPAHLDDVARAEWKRAGKQLVALELLTAAEIPTLEGYCTAYSRALAAGKVLRSQGTTYTAPWGVPMPRPEVAIEKGAWADVRRFAQELGLTPSARSRVKPQGGTKAPEKQPANPWEKVG